MKKFSLESNHLGFQSNNQLVLNFQYEKQFPRHASCLFQKIRITRIGSLDTLTLKKKPILHTEQQEDKIDEFSRVDILQDTYLEETRAVLELLMNEQKHKNKSMNMHTLKVKQPFKFLRQKTIVTKKHESQLNSCRTLESCLGNSQIESTNRIAVKRILNKEIEDILSYKDWKKNVPMGLIQQKQNTKKYHLLNSKKNIDKIKTNLKNKNDSDRKPIKLTINIQETIQKNYRK